jgi:cold shock CspA family protein
MATGTVKSFNPSKGYGFIRTDSGGKDVFVHFSAVREAGLANLRRGQKLNFDIFDNQGKAAARNLRVCCRAMKDKLGPIQNGATQSARRELNQEVNQADVKQLKGKRTLITRAALEVAIAEAVRGSGPECEGLIGIFVEQVVPILPGAANWAVKGVKYGKAERNRCSAAISNFVNERQSEFEVSDF